MQSDLGKLRDELKGWTQEHVAAEIGQLREVTDSRQKAESSAFLGSFNDLVT